MTAMINVEVFDELQDLFWECRMEKDDVDGIRSLSLEEFQEKYANKYKLNDRNWLEVPGMPGWKYG